MSNNSIVSYGLLDILKKYTDEDHQMTVNDLIARLEKDYEAKLERKAIKDKIDTLNDSENFVEHVDGKGYYFDNRLFDRAELRLLIDSVLCCRHINDNETNKIIDKLASLDSVYFKEQLKHVRSAAKWGNVSNNIFYQIDAISRAINEKKVIFFHSQRYVEKNEKLELKDKGYACISPYTMVLSNQHYYVMGYSEFWHEMVFLRIDKIKKVHVDDKREKHYIEVREVKGYEQGINYTDLSVGRPYLFNDKLESIKLKVKKDEIDQVVDWFGKDIKVNKYPGEPDYVLITLKTSPLAMQYWALQYLECVEVLEPIELRQKIGDVIAANIDKYKDVIYPKRHTKVLYETNAYVKYDDLIIDTTEVQDLTEGFEK